MKDGLNIQALIHRAVDDLTASGQVRREDLDPKVVAGMVTDTLRKVGREAAESMRSDKPRMLVEHHTIRDGFEERLADLWDPGLDALEAVNVAAFEAGENAY